MPAAYPLEHRLVYPRPTRFATPRARTRVRAGGVLGVLAFALACVPAPVSAQSSRTQGLFVGGHFEGASLVVEDSDRSNGGGGGLLVGYALENGIGVFAQLDGSNVDVRNQPDVQGKWTIAHLDLGLRYHFANPERSAVPYLQAAVSARDVRVKEVAVVSPTPTDEVDASGFGVTVGGGVLLHPAPSFAFEIGLLFGWGKLSKAELDGVAVPEFEADVQSSRLNMGVIWWP